MHQAVRLYWLKAIRFPARPNKAVLFCAPDLKPNDNKAVYDQLYVQWKDVYKSELELAEEGKIKSMWRAPGL